MFDVETKDDGGVAGALVAFAQQFRAAVAGALVEEAEETLTASAPLVPVDEGILKASGRRGDVEDDGTDISVTIGYGIPGAEPYAVVQHENLDYQHTVGQAKYLEQPVNERAGSAPERIAERVRARMGM
jgi:hypothetical protein